MKGIGSTCFAVVLAVTAILPAAAAAQARPGRAAVEAPEPPPPPRVEFQFEPFHGDRPALRIAQDYTLKAGNSARDVAVFFGNATIDGQVDNDVLVVGGTARLSSTAVIDGNLVVIGGSAAVSDGAQIRRDLFILGSQFDAPAGFAPGGAHIVIGPASLNGRLQDLVTWATRGLFWGRLIVPDLGWIWTVVGVFLLVYLALNLVFDDPVRACAATLVDKPLTAFVAGALVLLLTGPVCLLLAISVVGIAVVPFVVCALFVAGLIGKVGVARWIGMRVVPQPALDDRLRSLRSFVIGFVIITVAYMVPVLGVVVWTIVGVLGLGSAALAFISGYRRENPPAPRRKAPAPAPPVASACSDAPSVPGSAPAATAAAPAIATDLAWFPRAPFRDRLGAFVLDIVLVVVAAQMVESMQRENGRSEDLLFLLLLAYHIGFWAWKGTTMGGIICQLRIVRVDGTPLRFVDALVRGLSAIFSLAVLGIGCLWMIWDPESQTWHDRIAGTYVVKVPRNQPL